jgi:hypothetical protein
MSIGIKTVTGVFEHYEDAESAVEDLEELGISGNQVLLIPGADTDARGRGYVERSGKSLHHGETFGEKVQDALHLRPKEKYESSWVGVDGQPKMPKGDPLDVEDAELTDRDPALAGPAVVIVRLLNEKLEDEAAKLLDDNGAVQLFRDGCGGCGHGTRSRQGYDRRGQHRLAGARAEVHQAIWLLERRALDAPCCGACRGASRSSFVIPQKLR